MIKNFTLLCFLLTFSFTTMLKAQSNVLIDFEVLEDGYTTTTTSGSGSTDVFNRVNPNIGGNSSYIFAAEDLINTNSTIFINQINVSTFTSFEFSLDMLTPNTSDWDTTDEMKVSYSLDGGTFQNLLWVQSKPDGDASNAPAAIDDDFDGNGDTQLLPALVDGHPNGGVPSDFQNFSVPSVLLNGAGTLDIEVEFFKLDANDEGIYLDNISIQFDNMVSPSVGFDSATSSATETNAPFTVDIPVTLSNYDGNQVTLDVTAGAGGTAEPGDFNILSSSISFTGDETKMVSVEIVDDADMDNETIVLELSESTGTGITISTASHTINVTDDDIPTYDIVINEILADPPAGADPNNDGNASTTQDEFVEIYNFGSTAVDLSNWEIYDGNGLRHSFSGGISIAAGSYIVVFGGGAPSLPSVTTYVASTGTLGLSNGGDIVRLLDVSGNLVDEHNYGAEGGNNQSLARSPDATGPFVQHNAIATNPVDYSPGLSNITAVLPIELLQFTAREVNQEVILNWATATELNNDYMEVERSVDGVHFDAIAKIDGGGNSTLTNNYEVRDVSPYSGVNYYRLKQVDFDGTYAYHPVVSVYIDKANLKTKLYPNPVLAGEELRVEGLESGSVLKLYDAEGRVLLQHKVFGASALFLLSTEQYKAGRYTLQIDGPAGLITKKFIIQ